MIISIISLCSPGQKPLSVPSRRASPASAGRSRCVAMTFDVVVLGATGFTGKLACDTGHHWALHGDAGGELEPRNVMKCC